MAVRHEVIGYIPLKLVSDTLAAFIVGSTTTEWSDASGTFSSGTPTVVDVQEGELTEITIADYLLQDAISDLVPFRTESEINVTLEYWNSTPPTAWVTAHATVNYDVDDFDPDPTGVDDFIVKIKDGDNETIQVQIPRTISSNIENKYRLKVEIKQDDEDE